MKKLTAILKGCKLVDRLFGLREKEIRRVIEGAKDECERQKVEAQMDYEIAMKCLGGESVDYKSVLNRMLEAKQVIINAENTLLAIEAIEEDLDKEAELETEDKE